MTLRHLLSVLLLLLVLAALPSARAEDPPADPSGPATPASENETPTKDWRQLAAQEGLTKADVECLARDKVLVGPQSGKQVFSAYLGCDLPLFLTSDSILNAFHVVFEASLVELEGGRAEALADHLAFLLRRLPVVPEASGMELPADLLDRAMKRAQTTLGVALVLLHGSIDDLPAAVRETVFKEGARVRGARGTSKPAWLGPPDETFTALDYSRFKPRGFYDRTEELQRFFRAVSWLQAVPFRVGVDEELLAALLMAKAAEDPHESTDSSMAAHACRQFLAGETALWGPADDLGLGTGYSWTTPFELDELRAKQQQLTESAQEALVSDQVAFGPLGPAMRILPAARLPDAVLFQRTTNEIDGRALPTGLEVAAALGSPVAGEPLVDAAEGQVAAQIERTRPLFEAAGLYPAYLRAVGKLVGPAEHDAPALFSSRPWQVKSCQTLLAAWAQMRHAYVLHAKQSAHYLGLTMQEPGFVEPVPSFFRALRDVTVEATEILRMGGAFDTSRVRTSLARDLRTVANQLDVIDPETIGDRYPWNLLGQENEARAMRAFEVVYACGAFEGWPESWDGEALQRLIIALRTSAAKLEDRDTPVTERMAYALEAMTLNLEGTWEALEHVLIELELLAHKQLRGVAFDAGDRTFIEHYGQTLAGLMFYGGNLWLTPRDDAPRVVDVASDPQTGRVLLAGIGRPRLLYVLYPHLDTEILCRGAVLPYHEVIGEARLTDTAWRERLDASQPAPPAWLAPILSEQPVLKPEDH